MPFSGTQTKAVPIVPWKTLSTPALSFPIRRFAEKASDTQLIGTPCYVDSTGYLLERTAIDDATKVIAGFTTEFGSNLTSSGVAQTLSFGKVQNQASAVNIPIGAPPNDGTLGFYVATDNVWFKGKVDGAHTLAQADVGTVCGIRKDGTANYWFVDTTDNTVADGACVEITELIDPIGTVGGFVAFRVMQVRQQFGGA